MSDLLISARRKISVFDGVLNELTRYHLQSMDYVVRKPAAFEEGLCTLSHVIDFTPVGFYLGSQSVVLDRWHV